VLSALLFYALDPAVDWMERWRMPRAIGAALMILVVIGAVGGLAYSLQSQALETIDQLPTGARKLASSLRRTGTAPTAIEKVQQAADTLQASKDSAAASPGVMRVQVENP